MSLNSTSGDPAADSYIALADAQAYFAARGVTTFTGATSDLENALRRGTSYLENQYRDRWVGITTAQTQSLAWPRVDGLRGYYRGYTQLLLDLNGWPIPQTTVPLQIQNAAAEAALLIFTGTVMEPNLVRGNAIKSTSIQVDVIKQDIVYQDGAPSVDRYLVIEGLLRGLVTSFPGSSGGTVQLVRS